VRCGTAPVSLEIAEALAPFADQVRTTGAELAALIAEPGPLDT
jgi:hypothetical protein